MENIKLKNESIELYCIVYSEIYKSERKVKTFTDWLLASTIADAMIETKKYTVHFIKVFYID